jgi:hypothetical protein
VEKLRIFEDLFRKVRNTYETTVNCVKTNKGQSTWFETRPEVRQESIFLPILFNIIMEKCGIKLKINLKFFSSVDNLDMG